MDEEEYTTTNWNDYTRYECLHVVDGHKCNFDVLEDEAAMLEHLMAHAHDKNVVLRSSEPVEVVGEEYEPYLVGMWQGYPQFQCRYCPLDMLDDGSHDARRDMEDHYAKQHAQKIMWEQHLADLEAADEAKRNATQGAPTDTVDVPTESEQVSLVHEETPVLIFPTDEIV